MIRIVFSLVLMPLARALSWRASQRLGRWLGTLAWRVGKRDRQRILDHLAVAFPELDEARREEMGRACAGHVFTCVTELLHAFGHPAEEVSRHAEIVGFDEIEKLREEERRIVLMTGHCGNWEMISAANISHGLGLAAIARRLDDDFSQQMIVDLRAHLGSETIARGGKSSARQMLKTLRRKGALALLIDQDIRGADGVWVPFFGRLAHTPTAAAEIALRMDAAVVPTFSERLADGSHRVTFHAPLDLPDDLLEATAIMTRAIEEQIRRQPEQWVWMHRRWRQQPTADDAERVWRDDTLVS